MTQPVRQFAGYLRLLVTKWILWLFLILDAVAFGISFLFPHLTLPHAAYWVFIILALLIAGFQAYRDQAALIPAEPSFLERARDALDSPNEEERFQAIHTLAQMTAASARDLLAEAARMHPGTATRVFATFRLARLDDMRALPGLLEALASSDPSTRRQAVELLGNMGPGAADATARLCGILRSDENVEIRRAAARALGKIGHTVSTPFLAQLLQDDTADQQMRLDAAQSLALMHDTPAIQALEKAMRNTTNRAVYTALYEILDGIGTPEARQARDRAAEHQHIFGFGRDDRRNL